MALLTMTSGLTLCLCELIGFQNFFFGESNEYYPHFVANLFNLCEKMFAFLQLLDLY